MLEFAHLFFYHGDKFSFPPLVYHCWLDEFTVAVEKLMKKRSDLNAKEFYFYVKANNLIAVEL